MGLRGNKKGQSKGKGGNFKKKGGGGGRGRNNTEERGLPSEVSR